MRFQFPALGAGYMYLLLASNFGWLIALFTCVVIGQSNYFGLGLTNRVPKVKHRELRRRMGVRQ